MFAAVPRFSAVFAAICEGRLQHLNSTKIVRVTKVIVVVRAMKIQVIEENRAKTEMEDLDVISAITLNQVIMVIRAIT
jgi:hypothetical protein